MQLAKSIKPAFGHLFKDKVNFIFTAIPVSIGMLLYYLFGSWFFNTFITKGKALIESNISNDTGGSILTFILGTLLSVVLYFVVSWTFVLVVSIVGSPFNDLISSRIEKKKKGEELDSLPMCFKRLFSNMLKTIFTEAKKLFLIAVLTIAALLLNLFPVLAPLSFALSALLLAAQFLDYSWSRNNYTFTQCVGSIKGDILPFILVGAGFMALISIPVVNLIVPPLATSFFTDYFVSKKQLSS
jgi:CysZ protein